MSQASSLLGDWGKCEHPHVQQRRGRVPTGPVFPHSAPSDVSRQDCSMQRSEKERAHPLFFSELRENRKVLTMGLNRFVWICFSTQWACGSITMNVTIAHGRELGKRSWDCGPGRGWPRLKLLSHRDTCDKGHLPRVTWGLAQLRMHSLAATPPSPTQEHVEMEAVSEKS